MPDINMPKLSDTMEEGTIVEWKKKSGDQVKAGEVLAEVESDKATFDLEAESDGVLQILVEQGVPAKIGAPIAKIGEAGAQAKSEPAPAKSESAPAKSEPAPAKQAPAHKGGAAEPKPKGPETPATMADEREPAQESSPPPESPAERPAPPREESQDGQQQGAEVRASPLARRLAEEMGVDLSSLKGSGPDGRIVKEDVIAAGGTRPKADRRRAQPAAGQAAGPEVEVVEPSRMQATIARRMAEAKSTIPEFQVTVEARVDLAVSLRQQLKDSVPGAEKVTMTDFLVRACALALRKFPEVNSSWVEGRFQRKRSVNIGLAVAPSQGMGLLVPVVHDADIKDLVQISIESRQVIERARSGRVNEGDLTGATFSISNLGMYGVDEFTAIINPPEAAILAVGAIKDVPVVEDARIVAGKVMRMTLSVDHRVFYGATAAQFMAEVKRLLENPVTLLISLP
ncbi:MAG: 2-oxo acid dehydrogenase subunit E2 [Chloroflexi bacterium]|nr:MAG: 2-oxo acid dehydrogenase subunit E2 [Chloroflexota bacterium]TMG45203.1 MAG: 2-oxo acid dehydrogenase subunit E2 [Chloroflexota bacterium]